MKSLQGQFLVAAPQLEDPNFYRTVVLMLQHDEQGAMGVVLNRPSESTVGQVWLQVSEAPCNSLESVHIGGPVPGPLLAVHRTPSLSESTVTPGVYLATQKDHLDELVRGDKPYRMFSGYAGWAGGQLEGELKLGGWLVSQATPELIFLEPEGLWTRVTQLVGQEFVRRLFPDGHAPADPSLN